MSWPIAFMVWCGLWQCSAQSPGASATNSKARMAPTGTSMVVSGQRAMTIIARVIGHEGLGDADEAAT
jgi:hypothetical protein